MGLMTEFFASQLVPRLTLGGAENGEDAYVSGFEVAVTTDGYAVTLPLNTVFELQTRSQAIYYGILSDSDCQSKRLVDLDDNEKLALLNSGANINGHYLAAGSVRTIATTRKCRYLVIKAAANTATVNINPLGSFTNDLGGR